MRKLSRFSEHRLAMLRNLCISLINNGRIITTLHRAKELRMSIEPLITRARDKTLHNRRILLSYLNNNEEAVNKLFNIGQKNEKRPGGYTRVVRCGFRSDGGTKALIQIIDYPQIEVGSDQGNR
jgi:large subunit ribosomal protein L17